MKAIIKYWKNDLLTYAEEDFPLTVNEGLVMIGCEYIHPIDIISIDVKK